MIVLSLRIGQKFIMHALAIPLISLTLFLALPISAISQQATPSTSSASTQKITSKQQALLENESLEKKVREWLSVLVLPIALLIGGNWLERQTEKHRLDDQRRTEKRQLDDYKEQRQQETLKDYFGGMTTLLVKEHLTEAKHEDPVSRVAQALTITALRELDMERRNQVSNFLLDSKLIQSENSIGSLLLRDCRLVNANLKRIWWPNVDLMKANLINTDLREANLRETNLSEARLISADLQDANFKEADLSKADLRGADLSGANFCRANLRGARLNDVTLSEITRFNGSIYNSETRFSDDFNAEEHEMIEAN